MTNKYMWIGYNKKEFMYDKFGDETFNNTSRLIAVPLDKEGALQSLWSIRGEHFESPNGPWPFSSTLASEYFNIHR